MKQMFQKNRLTPYTLACLAMNILALPALAHDLVFGLDPA